jgi:hypothetical protein
MSVSRANWISSVAPFSRLVEVSSSTPAICWIDASTGEVAKASTVSGEAPGQVMATFSRGNSVLGRSSTGTPRQAATPRRATEA